MTSSREYTRVILTICCLVMLVLSAVSLPAISNGPTASAAGSSQSGDAGAGAETQTDAESDSQDQSASSNGGQEGGERLGALSAADRTTVGGDRSAFRSTGQRVHFVVRSTHPTYWRTNAYGVYTTSGWESRGESTASDGGVPVDPERQRRVVQRYRLNRSGTSLPAAWRPVTVGDSDTEIRVTERRTLEPDTPLEAGSTYSVISYAPPRDPEQLRESTGPYPEPIETRYTQLPSSTRDRLEPFTRRIVGDSESPYATAVRIEAWLEANKEYSLNASHTGEDVATAFVFDMERGYCEYFATAMVAMLRSQDVPARYVTGYSTGQPVGEDTYVVRGMNAHAWVEVYFEGVGWVRFDPTPGGERLDAEAQAYAQGGGGSGSGFTGSGSDGSSDESGGTGSESGSGFGGGESGGIDGGSGDGDSDGSGSGNGTTDGTGDGATSDGSSGTASAYRHQEVGSPGEVMGRTAEDGEGSSGSDTTESGSGSDRSTDETTRSPDDSQESQSTPQESEGETEEEKSDADEESDADDSSDDGSTPPLETELNRTELVPGTDVRVTVTRDGDPVADATVRFNGDRVGVTDRAGTVVGTVPYAAELNVSVTARDAAAAVADPPPLRSRSQFDVRAPPRAALRRPTSGATATADVDTYEVETNATIDVAGPPIPGSTVVVAATIEGTPLPGARVSVGGSTVRETNRSGRARITLPSDVRSTRVRVARGDVAGERDVSLVTELNVTVGGDFYPGGEAKVAVTAGGRGVGNATVTIDGRGLGRTADDGNVTGRFPETAGRVTVTAARGVAEGTRTLTLGRLDVTATPRRAVAFPWTEVRVRTELGNESVGGVAVRLNGQSVGETGPDGSLNATLPPTYGTTITAVGYGQRTTTAAGNPLLSLAVAAVAGLAIVGGGVRAGRRSERTVRGSATSALGLGVRVSQRLLGALVTLASTADGLVRMAVRGLRVLRDDIAAVPPLLGRWARRIHRGATDLLDRGRRGVRRVAAWIPEFARRVYALVRDPKRLGRLLFEYLKRSAGSATAVAAGSADGDRSPAGGAPGDSGSDQDPRLTVREAWREFLGHVSVRRWETKTPGEISRRAIRSDDLPPDAVRLLTESFREVEYGTRSAEDTVAGARDALERIERARNGDDGGEDG